MMLKDPIDSPSLDEGRYGGLLARGGVLKKGPWTSDEDVVLVDYVKKHGEGNWNAVQKNSGLLRCGKSCRLRWANHLRANLKKGSFAPAEENFIIEQHAKMGNKWARMAAQLPGRTDNEIKNYWNTRVKRRQRAGLPLYPPNVCFQFLNQNLQSKRASESSSGDKWNNELFQGNTYDIADVIFKANQGALSYATPSPGIPVSGMPSQCFGTQNFDFLNPTVNHVKWLREPETLFPNFPGSVTSGLPSFEQFPNDPYVKIGQTFGLGYPNDPGPSSKNPVPVGGAVSGSHALLNGIFSASKPLPGTVKLELPSLQYPVTDLSTRRACHSMPPLEAVDTYIQSPAAVSDQSDCFSPRNSGLLEAWFPVTPNLCETDWEEFSDPISPLGCSAAADFSACTPISGSPLDEFPPAPSGTGNILATVEYVSTPDVGKNGIPPQSNISRPDALLGADWLQQSNGIAKDHYFEQCYHNSFG